MEERRKPVGAWWKGHRKWLAVVLMLVMLPTIGVSARNVYTAMSGKAADARWLVVIDPGHGGFDPGKVGVDSAMGKVLEKDINLEVALKLRTLLEQNDVRVILTRETDVDLADDSSRNAGSKKSSDMRNRVQQVNGAGADLAISIHQNSFTDSASSGAQVFYHGSSPEGQSLAEILQQQLKTTLQDGNRRMAKSNASYYMLKKTECPFAIVECGFLSNPEEATRLQTEGWQDKLAWAIHLGVLKYLNGE